MKKYDFALSFASWEPRFVLGWQRNLEMADFGAVAVVYSHEFQERTTDSRNDLKALCESRGSRYSEMGIDHRSPWTWWNEVGTRTADIASEQGRTALLDFSTMPRDVIWHHLSILRNLECKVDYSYWKPAGYGEWLTADPGHPRLIYRHSGVPVLTKDSALVVATGFDAPRTTQLYYSFEPKVLYMLLQSGSQFGNQRKNIEGHLAWARGKLDSGVSVGRINAYAPDLGEKGLEAKVRMAARHYNVTIASLGPKPSAIAAYKVWMKHQQCALVYVPSGQYSKEYSKGISEQVFGSLQ